jgi:3'(2'), 5'-bisphosphate nucleotidase
VANDSTEAKPNEEPGDLVEDDVALASRLAVEAGALLLDLRERRHRHLDEWDLGDEGDFAANQFLLRELGKHRPDDIVLSEEAPDQQRRLDCDRVWIIDPLDGTREYRTMRHDWAVHVALWTRKEGLTAGAVSLPPLNEVRTTINAGQRRVAPPSPVVLVSRSRRPWVADLVAAEIGGVVDSLGSAGAKTMAVVSGQADVYLNPGGLWEWDAAAPAAVAEAAGFVVRGAYGQELTYNNSHPWVDGFVVCRADLADTVFKVLADAV